MKTVVRKHPGFESQSLRLLPLDAATRCPAFAVSSPTYGRAVKVRDVVRLLEDDGWRLDRQRGSHRQYRHADKRGTVTIAGQAGDELKTGTLASIFRQAGIERDQR